MYERAIKNTDPVEMGWGCPCCFIRLPAENSKPNIKWFGLLFDAEDDIELKDEPEDFWLDKLDENSDDDDDSK